MRNVFKTSILIFSLLIGVKTSNARFVSAFIVFTPIRSEKIKIDVLNTFLIFIFVNILNLIRLKE